LLRIFNFSHEEKTHCNWLLRILLACIFHYGQAVFILMQYHSSFQNDVGDLLGTFWHGAKLDISTTGYYLIIPLLLLIPGVYFNGSWYRIVIKWYSYILIIFSSIIIVSDANLYSYWGFRMDYTPMLYLKTPGEAMASVSTLKIIMFLITIG